MFTRNQTLLPILGLLAVSSTAPAGLIFGSSSLGEIASEAAVNAASSSTALLDPDEFTFAWDEMAASGEGIGANSASASSGQIITDPIGDTFSGRGSANASAIATLDNEASAGASSFYEFVFEVDAQTKVEIDWAFLADASGAGSEFEIGWVLTGNGGLIDSVILSEGNDPGDWVQSDTYSLIADPGIEYVFFIGTGVDTEAGINIGERFGAVAAQWSFEFTIPTPSTAVFAGLSGLLLTRRRR